MPSVLRDERIRSLFSDEYVYIIFNLAFRGYWRRGRYFFFLKVEILIEDWHMLCCKTKSAHMRSLRALEYQIDFYGVTPSTVSYNLMSRFETWPSWVCSAMFEASRVVNTEVRVWTRVIEKLTKLSNKAGFGEHANKYVLGELKPISISAYTESNRPSWLSIVYCIGRGESIMFVRDQLQRLQLLQNDIFDWIEEETFTRNAKEFDYLPPLQEYRHWKELWRLALNFPLKLLV